MLSNHLVLCCPLLLLPSVFPSIRVFSNESGFHISLPKCWSLSFNISLSNGHSGLISFWMDWLDLFVVQVTLKSLQLHSSKASILWHSDSKEVTCDARDLGSISESGRFPGGGHGYPLQYSCLGTSMDRGVWRAAAHGVTKSQTRLSD